MLQQAQQLQYVATALTVYGIETILSIKKTLFWLIKLQQPLPFTVLKQLKNNLEQRMQFYSVATALTVYGIETVSC